MPISTKKLLEEWKQKLLDITKRNSLLNYRNTKRGSLQIIYPAYNQLFMDIMDEKQFTFAKPSEEELFGCFIGEEARNYNFNIKSSKDTLEEEQSSLRTLRRKAKTISEEQGINVLHLTFGQLKWTESESSTNIFVSPLILVPVSLNIESIVSPYTLELQDEDLSINPTLNYKLEHDFNLSLPNFNIDDGLDEFFNKCENIISDYPGWSIERTVHLSTFSYLKINMYNDLSANEEVICDNSFVKALSGDLSDLPDCHKIIEDVSNLDLDKDTKPEDTFQVLDADSSQQEAIELAKRGTSYVLQGPPGTGKSQTITNIIAESLANGKKVLFVSEKEAALDVVRNRITQTDLMDFCLAIHSHKANKKEIINNLYHTTCMSRIRFKEENLSQLQKLYENRNKLNIISKELHTVISPLQISVFQANGELSKLESCKDVIFECARMDSIDNQIFDKQKEKIGLLTEVIGAFKGDRFSPTWGDCILPSLSQQNKNDFRARINDDFIFSLKEISESIQDIIGNPIHISWNDISKIVELLELCASGSPLPTELRNANIDELIVYAQKWQQNKRSIGLANDVISSQFPDFDTSFDVEGLREEINGLYQFITKSTSLTVDSPSSNSYFDSIAYLSRISKSSSQFISSLFEIDKQFSVLKLDICNLKLCDIDSVYHLFSSLQQLNDIRESWFQPSAIATIRGLICEIEDVFDNISQIKDDLRLRFDDKVFEIDVVNLLPKFRTEYSSVLRFIKSSYRRDILTLRYCEKNGKLTYSDALSVLNKLQTIREKTDIISQMSAVYQTYFGLSDISSKKDVAKYHSICDCFERISDYYSGVIPATVQQFIIGREYERSEFVESTKRLKQLCSDSNTIDITASFAQNPHTQIFDVLSDNVEIIKVYVSHIDAGIKYIKQCSSMPLDNLANLDYLVDWCKYIAMLQTEDMSLRKSFGFLYQYQDTDWDKILSCLEWVRVYHRYESELSLPISFTDSVTSRINIMEECNDTAIQIRKIHNKICSDVEWFATWFSEEYSLQNKELRDFISIVQFYQNNLDYLDEWLSVRRILKGCRGLFLDSFIQNVVNNPDIPCNEYIGIYLKRFYAMWLDQYLPTLPTISTISKIELEKLINDFRTQDKNQFIFATYRIKERLLNQLPDIDFTAGANDQLSILKREYNKKRRQLPLRKLFDKIPSLIQTVKPCLMMSPLSVSLFLQNKDYNFDVVIFDEASQVKPENAIGAIIRGTQIIIAGDTHQLPPTSFFERTTYDDNQYDSNDEEDDVYAIEESILDAASNILPERYLKWHYRSRHEHLIAFSNNTIYDSKLTTFPSAYNEMRDYGVEFEYVPDGVYDRSRKRNNPKEAQKVAELVFEHFENHPDRTLGVISNSESQAHAIEDIILKMRLQKPTFEHFFTENRNEPFFIKSLESVQGDERDTIIFSVGYGKDSCGKMYNSFGPINLDGGERRLNVAITRAKYNLKLVSSILAEDINIVETSKKGPRLLKLYLDYAKRGMEAITNEIVHNGELIFDSPFEESVYNFLTERGYQIDTQIGCAGYRIDLGVRDPVIPGRYVLAIECDGATYHSSKYARERDRLRQNVLENMGWHFYRIWSSEWINHTSQEKFKLIDSVENAITNQNVLIDDTKSNPKSNNPDEELLIETVKPEISDNLFDDGINYEPYVKTDDSIYKLRYSHERIEKILECESPMHRELLCRRMAPHLGREKVTSVVRNEVDYVLCHYLEKKYIIENEFVYKYPKQKTYKIRDVSDRDIAHICPEELEDMMMQIARKAIGISPEDLACETGHKIGYIHCKERIMTILNDVFSALERKGILSVSPSGTVIVN